MQRLQSSASLKGMFTVHRKSFAIYVIFCLGIALLMGLYLYESHRSIMSEAKARVENTSLLVAEWIKGYFAQSDYVLRDIVGMVNASDILVQQDRTTARYKELSERIEAKRRTIPYTMRVAIFNRECVITHFPGYEHKIGWAVSELEYCKALRNNPELNSYITHAYLGVVGKTPHVLQARRFVDERGRIDDGFAGIAINLDLTGNILDSISIPPHGSITVVDINQMLIARRPVATEAVGKKVESPLIADFVQGGAQHSTQISNSPIDHEVRLISYRRLSNLPFLIAVGESQREILRTWYQQAWGIAVFIPILWWMAFIILRHYQMLLIQRQIIGHQATHDSLTGIPNLRLVMDRLQMAGERAKREQKKAAVLFIDLDGFKAANDHFGHEAGDHVLREVSKRIKQSLRNADTVGRKGGDEFVVILECINHADEACDIARKLVQLINTPISFKEHNIPIGASIGIAIFPDHCDEPEKILMLADQAMYKVKNSGKNGVALYSSEKN